MFKCIILNSCKSIILFIFIILGSILFYKYFNDIPQNEVLKIAVKNDNPPFSVKKQNNKIEGFNVDIIKKFLDELGVSYEFIALEQDELISAVEAGLYDMAIASNYDLENVEDKKLTQTLLITPPYIEIKNIIVKHNNDAFKYNKIGIAKSNYYKSAYNKRFKTSQILEFENYQDMYDAFNSHELDAIILNNLLFKHIRIKNKVKDFIIGKESLDLDTYVLIFPENSNYYNIFNKKFGIFKNKNTFKIVYQKWFGNS